MFARTTVILLLLTVWCVCNETVKIQTNLDPGDDDRFTDEPIVPGTFHDLSIGDRKSSGKAQDVIEDRRDVLSSEETTNIKPEPEGFLDKTTKLSETPNSNPEPEDLLDKTPKLTETPNSNPEPEDLLDKTPKPELTFMSERQDSSSEELDNFDKHSGKPSTNQRLETEVDPGLKDGNFSGRSKKQEVTADSVSSVIDDPQNEEVSKNSYNGHHETINKPHVFESNAAGEEEVGKDKRHCNKFRCPPCTCSHSHLRQIIANCTYQRLWGIPDGLPPETWKINMTRNYMKNFYTSDVMQYSSLFSLFVSFNTRLHQILRGSIGNESSKMTQLDLSFNAINFVEDRSFTIMPLLLNLSLSHNNLRNLTNSTFEGLDRLEILDVSVNLLTHIEYGAFDHMPNLKTLDLSRNKNIGYSKRRLSPRLFSFLKQLHNLYIQGNSKGEENYSDKALEQLTSLRQLTIDGLNKAEFGPGMRNLTNLKYLQLGFLYGRSFCPMEDITGTFFENIPFLESFSVFSCKLMRVNTTAYKQLTHLKSLSFSAMKNYDLFKALADLNGLQNSSLKSLRLVYLYHTTKPCRYLDGSHGEYLQYLPLEELDLTNNRLALLQDDFIRRLPTSLKRLILKTNKLTLIGTIINRMPNLINLVELDVRDQNTEVRTYAPADQLANEQLSITAQQCHSDQRNNSGCTENTNKNQRKEWTSSDMYSGLQRKWISIPPNLRYVLASSYTEFGSVILIHQLRPENNSLREINFANSFLIKWGAGSMPPHIRKANLDYNYCSHIKPNFFPPNNSLVHLSLRNNFLNYDIAEDERGEIFAELNKTIYLDLSMNYIYKIPEKFFKGMNSLYTLKLSENKLQVLNISFAHMKRLNWLDLSKNSISWIWRQARDELDSIAQLHELNVDLTKNPLPCTCAGLEVLIWMATTNVYLLDADFLQCRLDNGEIADIGNLQDRVLSLQRHCISSKLIIVICLASILLVLIVVGFGFMYRFRWKLRYLKNIALAKVLGFKPKLNEIEYRFDAYILYSDVARVFVVREMIEELEKKRGHRLCIEDRDFMPGTFIISDILSAVQNSAKTVPVVTPDFYDSDFSEYAMKMAIMEENHLRRPVLHLCLYQLEPDEEMSRDFLMVMDRNDYTEFPPADEISEEIKKNFWDQLSEAIGHHGNMDDQELREIA